MSDRAGPAYELPLAGCEMRLDEIDGILVFHVAFAEGSGPGPVRYGAMSDGAGICNAFAREPAATPIEDLVRAVRARTSDEPDWNSLHAMAIHQAFGSGRPSEVPTGDVAIHLAREMEDAYPESGLPDRIGLVGAMQRRMLDLGLSRVADAIGPARLRLHGIAMGGTRSLMSVSIAILRMDREKAERLVAAMDAFPSLSVGMSSSWRNPEVGDTPHGTVLAHLRRHGLDEARARAVARTSTLQGSGGPINMRMLRILGELPRDWIPGPGDPGGWTALRNLAPSLVVAKAETGQGIDVLARPSAGRWAAFAERLARAVGVELAERSDLEGERFYGTILDATTDLPDLREDIRTSLVLPLLSWAGGEESRSHDEAKALSQRLLFEGRGLPRIYEMSRVWHRAGGVRIAGREFGSGGWVPVLPPAAHGGVRIAPLSTKSELAAEGSAGRDADGHRGLSHCVASRWSSCTTGNSRVMGVRDAATGERLSTFEIAFDPSMRPRMVEHRGFANGTPPDEAMDAVRAYMAGLEGGVIPFDPAPLAKARRSGRDVSLEQLCGYDWRDGDLIAEAIAAWAPYMARPYRDLDPRAFHESLTGRAVDGPGSEVPRP
jgi:hypothetical protein